MAARTAGRVGACHEIPMCEAGVTNTKTGQEHLSVSDPLGGGIPSFDGGLNQGQAGVPVGLPGLADRSGDREIKVLKRQG